MDPWNQRWSEIAQRYREQIEPQGSELVLPHVEEGNQHVWHLFTVRSTRRDELQTFLENRGIGTLIHYPVPLYRQEAYKELRHLNDSFPISNAISEQILSLPMGPHLSKEAALYFCEAVNGFFETKSKG